MPIFLSNLGQYVNSIAVLTLASFVGEITGKFHFSYCTDAVTLNLLRIQKSARTPPSVSVPPNGTNC